MLEFATIQENAKQLMQQLASTFVRPHGCFGFFTSFIPQMMNSTAMEDARTLKLLASRLDHDQVELLHFVKNNTIQTLDFDDVQFTEYKREILVGMYVMLWSQYEHSISYYINHGLIEQFQQSLKIKSLDELDGEKFERSLNALSVYCSFIYSKREDPVYQVLNSRLGPEIQATIHTVRFSRDTDNSTAGCFSGIMCSFGLNNMS